MPAVLLSALPCPGILFGLLIFINVYKKMSCKTLEKSPDVGLEPRIAVSMVRRFDHWATAMSNLFILLLYIFLQYLHPMVYYRTLVVGSPVKIEMCDCAFVYHLKSCVCLYYVGKKPKNHVLKIVKGPNPDIFEIIVCWYENLLKYT